ncbi:exported hypothetical protein [Bradyrhizobium sp. STM 3843]|nr:exported hypothetical protein [Bradyrhizobium sp. STM 3843]
MLMHFAAAHTSIISACFVTIGFVVLTAVASIVFARGPN